MTVSKSESGHVIHPSSISRFRSASILRIASGSLYFSMLNLKIVYPPAEMGRGASCALATGGRIWGGGLWARPPTERDFFVGIFAKILPQMLDKTCILINLSLKDERSSLLMKTVAFSSLTIKDGRCSSRI